MRVWNESSLSFHLLAISGRHTPPYSTSFATAISVRIPEPVTKLDRLDRPNDIRTRRTLSEHARGAIGLLVRDQDRCGREVAVTARADTGSSLIVHHGKGEVQERVTLPLNQFKINNHVL